MRPSVPHIPNHKPPGRSVPLVVDLVVWAGGRRFCSLGCFWGERLRRNAILREGTVGNVIVSKEPKCEVEMKSKERQKRQTMKSRSKGRAKGNRGQRRSSGEQLKERKVDGEEEERCRSQDETQRTGERKVWTLPGVFI